MLYGSPIQQYVLLRAMGASRLFRLQNKPCFSFIKNVDFVLYHAVFMDPLEPPDGLNWEIFKELVSAICDYPRASPITPRLRIANDRYEYMRFSEQLLYFSAITDLLEELRYVRVRVRLHLVLPFFLEQLVESNMFQYLADDVKSIEFSALNTGYIADDSDVSHQSDDRGHPNHPNHPDDLDDFKESYDSDYSYNSGRFSD